MILNEDMLRLEHKGKHVRLTLKQFRLVQCIYHQRRIVPRNELVDAVDPFMESTSDQRALDSLVKHVRKKMRETFGKDDWIKTTSGLGYHWDHADEDKLEPRGWRIYETRGEHALRRRVRRRKPHKPK